MGDIYKKLAKKLDGLPHGYPATESAVELKILRKIFPPEDAAMAIKLKPFPQHAEAIAKRLKTPVDEIRQTLDQMAAKGQIASVKVQGEQKYVLMPFLIGIYEFQLEHLDKELVELVEEYIPVLVKTVGGNKPALSRVIPVGAKINPQLQVLNYEDMKGVIEESKSFQLMDCICRKAGAIEGKPCRHPMEVCMMFSTEEGAYDYFAHAGKTITKEEALEIIDLTEKEGLVHATYNVQDDPKFVCNCCSCCCGLLKGMQEHKAPYILARSNFVAAIAQESCKACGVCADKRCPVEAIAEDNGNYSVVQERCIGCGVCAVTCPTESITLERRPESEQEIPPGTIIDWSLDRVGHRWSAVRKFAMKMAMTLMKK